MHAEPRENGRRSDIPIAMYGSVDNSGGANRLALAGSNYPEAAPEENRAATRESGTKQ
jgi:hypothetical protein